MTMVLLVKFVCWLALAATATAAALIEKCSAKKPLAPFLLQARSQQSKLESNHSYTFVHIPKTAGSEIENTLHKFGVEEGAHASWRFEAPYLLSQSSSLHYNNFLPKCSPWHIPPAQHVHGGWTIVREPIDRTLSEFCYRQGQVHEDGGTLGRPPCSDCKAKYFTQDCVGLNAWVEAILNSYSHSPWVNDCHMLPQWMYASKVDYIFSFEKLDDEDWPRIKTMYGLPANAGFLEKSAMVGYAPCKDAVLKPGCLTSQSTTLLKRHFHEDYEYLQSAGHFGPNLKL